MSEINNLLEQLKETLENVDSARKQTEDTVKSYSQLQKEINKYVQQLEIVANIIEQLVNSISSQETAIKANTDTFVKSLKDVSQNNIDEFKIHTKEIVSNIQTTADNLEVNLQEQGNTLKSNASKIKETFTNECSNISKQFKRSGEELVNKLNGSISEKLESLRSNIQKLQAIEKNLSKSADDVKDVRETMKSWKQGTADSLRDVDTDIKAVKKCCDDNGNLCKAIKEDISSFHNDMVKQLSLLATLDSLSPIITDLSSLKSEIDTKHKKLIEEGNSLKSDIEEKHNEIKDMNKSMKTILTINLIGSAIVFFMLVYIMFVK